MPAGWRVLDASALAYCYGEAGALRMSGMDALTLN